MSMIRRCAVVLSSQQPPTMMASTPKLPNAVSMGARAVPRNSPASSLRAWSVRSLMARAALRSAQEQPFLCSLVP